MEIEHGLLIIKMVFASLTLPLICECPWFHLDDMMTGPHGRNWTSSAKNTKNPFLQIIFFHKWKITKMEIFISIMKSVMWFGQNSNKYPKMGNFETFTKIFGGLSWF